MCKTLEGEIWRGLQRKISLYLWPCKFLNPSKLVAYEGLSLCKGKVFSKILLRELATGYT